MKSYIVAALLAAGLSSAAQAQSYAGAALGAGRINIDCQGADKCDKSDVGYKLVLGHQFNPNIAVEVGYTSFGEAKVGDSSFPEASGKINASALSLAAVGLLPINPQLTLSAKLGLARVDTHADVNIDGSGDVTLATDKVRPYVGLQADYAITPTVKAFVFADFTRASLEVAGERESATTRLIGVGVKVGF